MKKAPFLLTLGIILSITFVSCKKKTVSIEAERAMSLPDNVINNQFSGLFVHSNRIIATPERNFNTIGIATIRATGTTYSLDITLNPPSSYNNYSVKNLEFESTDNGIYIADYEGIGKITVRTMPFVSIPLIELFYYNGEDKLTFDGTIK
ncbi:hypothetical protein AD998_11625 [bacterium 336/3]|nr:hypothetical protein AD998_11625 [bacterium 336/3]